MLSAVRQQLVSVSVEKGGSDTLLNLQWSHCPGVTPGNVSESCIANNGDVLSSRVFFGARGAAAGLDATTTYGYDPLGRIKSAEETSGMRQLYVYDVYGNRALKAGIDYYIPGNAATPQVSADDPLLVEGQFPNNRWSGVT